MNTFILMKQIIMTHRKSKEQLLNMADTFYANDRLNAGEYKVIIDLINEEYPENNNTEQ